MGGVILSKTMVGSDSIVDKFKKNWGKETSDIFNNKKSATENNKDFIKAMALNPQDLEKLFKTLSDSELKSVTTFLENNFITKDNKITGLSWNAWNDPSEKKMIQTYFKLRAEQILRETDKKMENHYKKWIKDTPEDPADVTATIKELSQKNVDLIKEFSSKFGDSALDLAFFVDLVNTDKIWDIKNRTSSVTINTSEKKYIEDRIGKDNYKKALISSTKNSDIIESNLYSKDYNFKGNKIPRDYLGNYHYGYIGGEYIDFTIPYIGLNDNSQEFNYTSDDIFKEVNRYFSQPLLASKSITKEQILTEGASFAQMLSNLKNLKFGGDPPEDTQAILDGLRDYNINN